MDRLTSIDAGFLAQEREGSHIHIRSVMLFEGPSPPREEFIAHISRGGIPDKAEENIARIRPCLQEVLAALPSALVPALDS